MGLMTQKKDFFALFGAVVKSLKLIMMKGTMIVRS